MKRFICQLFVLTSLVFMAASCQKAPFLTLNTPRSFTFTRDGGTQSITFTCNRDWSVSSSESWIQVSPSSGTASDGEVTVKITCAANTTYDPRSATVTIKVEELTEAVSISQDTGLGLIVSPKTLELTNAKQTIEIEVQKNVQYSIAIDNESAEWIKQGGTKALTTDKVTFTIEANTSYDNREGKITFKQLDGNLSETVVVRQSQTNGLFITTPDYSLSNEAHTLSVEVKANVEFDVTSQADWITYVETKALKASTITLSIQANEGYDNRTGTVLVKQKNGDLTGTITITQKQTDYLEVTPTSFDLDNQQHEIELKVTQNVAYSVVIPDDAKSWVYVPTKSATKGLVEDTVRLVVDANSTYDDRETSVTIKQNDGSLAGTVVIKQAYGEGLIPDQTSFEINRYGGSLDIGVQANVEYEVATEATWVHYVETKGLVGSTVVLTIDENPSYTPREATVSIKQKSGGLVADVTVKQTPFGEVEFEGYTYKTVKYGEKEWFAENLRAKFGQEKGNTVNQYGSGTEPDNIYFWAEQNGELLYSLNGLSRSENLKEKTICPEGWHISNTEDWKDLFSLSSTTSAAPFVKKELGGTDEFSFGGNYGKWHSSSFWLEMMLFHLFEDCIIINKEDGAFVQNRSANQRHYPSEEFRFIRCVRGPASPITQTLPVIKQTTTTAELRVDVINDPKAITDFFVPSIENPSKLTKVEFKYGTNKDNLSSSVSSSDGKWSVNVSGLTPGTKYFYQPVVEYEGGIGPVYGEIMSFRTYYGTLEYQGDVYFTTLLGNVEFMSQNLRSTSLNDGTAIPLMSASSEWFNAEGPGQCVAYNKDEYLVDLGRLYNGYAMQTGKVCPNGWRLPKYSELLNADYGNYLNSDGELYTGALFLSDRKYWPNPVFCNNDWALSLLPSGCRYSDDWYYENGFYGEGWQLYLWAINDGDSDSLNAFNGALQLGIEGWVKKYNLNDEARKKNGYAVRCVRDK